MKNKIYSTLMIFGLAISCLAAIPSYKAEATPVSEYLIEEGIKSYEAGDHEKAINQLSKVLIIEPDNQVAKDYLQKMGLQDGLFEPEFGRSASRAQDTAKEIQEYKDKLTALENEKFEKEKQAILLKEDKDYLKQAIESRNKELENLRQELEAMQAEMTDVQKFRESLRAEMQKSRTTLDEKHLKDRIDRQLGLIEEKDRQIKQLHKELKSSTKETRKKSLRYENKILDLKKEHRKSQSENWKEDVARDKKIELLRSRVSSSRAEIQKLTSNILLTNRKLAYLENKLSVKDAAIQELHQTLGVQRVSCSELKKKFDDEVMKKKEAPKFAGCPDAALYRLQDRKIADLKMKLAEAKREVTSLRKNVGKSAQEDVAVLKEHLADLEAEMQKKDATISDEEASYEIIDQRLKDAQERLSVANKMIQEKDNQIKDMEKQMGDLEVNENSDAQE